MSESKMEDVLYDYHLAQSVASLSGQDEDKLRYLYVQAVFQKHGITEAEFDSSMVWYSAHCLQLGNIYDRLNERFDNELTELGMGVNESELSAKIKQNNDSVANIWSGSEAIVLQNDNLHCLSTLTLRSDTTFRPGDDFELEFVPMFTSQRSSQAWVFLSVFYKDGSSKSKSQQIYGPHSNHVVLPSDINNNDRETDHINICFYYVPAEYGESKSFLCIKDPVLARFHRQGKAFGVPKPNVDLHQIDDVVKPTITDTTSKPEPDAEAEKILKEREEEVRKNFNLDREKEVKRPMRRVRRTF